MRNSNNNNEFAEGVVVFVLLFLVSLGAWKLVDLVCWALLVSFPLN